MGSSGGVGRGWVQVSNYNVFMGLFRLSGTKNIQGDSGEICNTLGNDSMCDSKQKSSYEHGSDFERLPRYGRKNFNAALAVML